MAAEGKKPSRGRGGRRPSDNPAKHHVTFRLDDDERARFDALFLKSGLRQRTKFIKAMLFSTPLRVVVVDKNTTDYFTRLTNFYAQFQAIGNNYNQAVRAIRSNFGEKRGGEMLYKLEKATVELVLISRQVLNLTREYEEKYLGK